MGEALSFYGNKMDVTVDFGDFFFPAYYLSSTNSINVDTERLKESDLGYHSVTIYGSYTGINGETMTVSKSLFITVFQQG